MDAQGPAETLGYLIAGFTVIFGFMLAYVVSLVIRFRNLKSSEAMLEELEQEQMGQAEKVLTNG